MSINKGLQTAPNLRFKGFTDDWEQRKLGDIADFSKGQGFSKKDLTKEGTPIILYGSMYTNFKTVIENINTFTSSGEGAVISEGGELIIPSSGESPREIARATAVLMKGIILGGDLNILKFAHENNSIFIAFSLSSEKYKNKLAKFAQGKSIVHLYNSDIKDLGIYIANPEEQSEISKLLLLVENTITLHQRKLDQLNQLKEALLQQMFPGKGETVPKLRFAGFEGDWEERKLGDLFIKGGSGGTPKSTNKDFYEGDIPFLGISDITRSNGFINNTEKHISVDGLNNSAAWVVPRGAISLAMYASVGKVAVLNIDAATSQAFYNMVFDDDDLRDFVYQCLIKANELSEWNKLISTGTQANLNADKVKNFMLYLPQNHAEIKLISAFLKQFDTTIAIHQRKLDQLKNMKQVLLENMFI